MISIIFLYERTGSTEFSRETIPQNNVVLNGEDACSDKSDLTHSPKFNKSVKPEVDRVNIRVEKVKEMLIDFSRNKNIGLAEQALAAIKQGRLDPNEQAHPDIENFSVFARLVFSNPNMPTAVFEALLNEGAEFRNKSWWVHKAARLSPDKVDILMNRGLDTTIKPEGMTITQQALVRGNFALVESLVSKGYSLELEFYPTTEFIKKRYGDKVSLEEYLISTSEGSESAIRAVEILYKHGQ